MPKNMEYVIDLNVILDVLLEREPYVNDSCNILKACQERKIKGYISANNVDTLFYVLHKNLHSNDKVYDALSKLLSIIKIIPLMSCTIFEALQTRHSDFEDCILALSAKISKCDGIITRNKKDFKILGVNTLSPSEFLQQYN